ncbi:MAG: hypothetical protein JSV13_06270 [Nitrospiraceae bacterium]|nr:MAG: hypothetical protein JSV13_06270 [Nitrospiraceae bacterium]
MKIPYVVFLVVITVLIASCDVFRPWTAPYYEEPGIRRAGKWKALGKTEDGATVYINTESIIYSSTSFLVTEAKTVVGNKEYIDRLEFDCPRYRFRIVERFSATKSRWRGIIVGSPSKIIHNELCPGIK